MICWQMGKTFRKAKTSLGEFKLTTPKNPLIKRLQVWEILPLWPIPKYQPIVEHSLQYPIGLDLVVAFVHLMHKSLICDWLLCIDSSTWLTSTTWMIVVGCKVLHFIEDKDYEAPSYKTLWCTNAVVSHREN